MCGGRGRGDHGSSAFPSSEQTFRSSGSARGAPPLCDDRSAALRRLSGVTMMRMKTTKMLHKAIRVRATDKSVHVFIEPYLSLYLSHVIFISMYCICLFFIKEDVFFVRGLGRGAPVKWRR